MPDRLPDVHALGGDGEPRGGEGVPVDGLGLRALGLSGRGGGKALADLEHHVREGVVQEVEGAHEGVAGGGGGARAGAGVNLGMYHEIVFLYFPPEYYAFSNMSHLLRFLLRFRLRYCTDLHSSLGQARLHLR